MQRNLLQSRDYCRAVNTRRGLLWTGSTEWRSIWQKHKSSCVCVCVCACARTHTCLCACVCMCVLRWQQPLRAPAQRFLSPAVEAEAGCWLLLRATAQTRSHRHISTEAPPKQVNAFKVQIKGGRETEGKKIHMSVAVVGEGLFASSFPSLISLCIQGCSVLFQVLAAG